MKALRVVFVKEWLVGFGIMIGAMAAGAALRALQGVSFADFPTGGLIKGVLVGGFCIGLALTVWRRRGSRGA